MRTIVALPMGKHNRLCMRQNRNYSDTYKRIQVDRDTKDMDLYSEYPVILLTSYAAAEQPHVADWRDRSDFVE